MPYQSNCASFNRVVHSSVKLEIWRRETLKFGRSASGFARCALHIDLSGARSPIGMLHLAERLVVRPRPLDYEIDFRRRGSQWSKQKVVQNFSKTPKIR